MPWCLRLQICVEIFVQAESVPCVYISSKSQHLKIAKLRKRFRGILRCKLALEIFVQFESVPCIYILQIAKSSNLQSCDSVVPVPETSERWVLDPMNNPWVDLCHQFRTTCYFECVWMCTTMREPRSISDGFSGWVRHPLVSKELFVRPALQMCF